ncbi:MAG: PQQ-binding-like beta-propeller repeat protein [Kiritimatiellae bacterium]|nr:PQQ-binding-like beta-propeller repeat protein [Kiritimatiellia bacterium]MDD5520302.1 PQQ-binding-like beta-propeller repeat protein [Kiritimatiellia bacterium]
MMLSRFITITLVLAGLIFCFPAMGTAEESDWPMWRYDANRSAASPAELPSQLRLQWKRELPAPSPAFPNDPRLCFDISYEPVVAGKTIFVPSMVSDSVTAYDTETGTEKWKFYADGPVRFAPIVDHEKLYFVSDDGCLYCLNAKKGRLLWKFCGLPVEQAVCKLLGNGRLISRWPARGGPVLTDGMIYYSAGIWPNEGVYIYAVDADSGKLIWVNKDANFVKNGLLDHGTRRDGGLSPQGYLAVLGQKLIVPCGRALPAFFDRKSGQMEPYTTGWGGRIGLSKGCWYACGIGDYLFQSGDLFSLVPLPIPPNLAPTTNILVSLNDFSQQMNIPPSTTEQLIKDFTLDVVEKENERFIRIQNSDPITYLSWNTSLKAKPLNAGERQAIETRTRVQIDPANGKDTGSYREPVLTKDVVYYSSSESNLSRLIKDENRRAQKSTGYVEIAACDITRPPKWGLTYKGGWGTPYRFVQWRVGQLDKTWSLPSKLKVHIKAGSRLYAGASNIVATVDIPTEGRQPGITWHAAIKGTPTRMLAADDRLFVVTEEGSIYCFGGSKVKAKTYTANHADFGKPTDEWITRAETILKRTGVKEGYCLVLGLGTGRLVEELVSQSRLPIVVLEKDAGKVDAVRRKFDALGLYGSRVHVLPGDLSSIKLSPFIAGLIVSEDIEASGVKVQTAIIEKLFALLRPYGGVACLPIPVNQQEEFTDQVKDAKFAGAEMARVNDLTLLARTGALPDAADWTHERGDEAYAFASKERHVRPPFGILWFGGELDSMIPCLTGPIPRVASGRMFLRVVNDLYSFDIYTGRHLWKRTLPSFGEFVADGNDLYVVSGGNCLRLNPATGEQANIIPVPKEAVKSARAAWQQIRIHGESLVGTAGKYLVCVDRQNGNLRWHLPSHRDALGLAVGAGKVFCVEYLLPIHRLKDKPETQEGVICALDLKSGKILWQSTVSIPVVEIPVKGQEMNAPLNPQLAFCEKDDAVVFTRNRSTVAAYHGTTGKLLWSGDIPCKDQPAFTTLQPPIILPGLLISHTGQMYELSSGSLRRERMWKGTELRGCGRALGCPNLITVRDGFASYFDLDTGKHTYFRGIRSGCMNSLVPAGGIINAPNFARQSCTCNYPISMSLAFVNMPEVVNWESPALEQK